MNNKYQLKPLAIAVACTFGASPMAYAQSADVSKQDIQTMPTVTVTGERTESLPRSNPGGQTARGGRLGVLGNADARNAPFSISSYTAQMMKDQQATTAADVLTKDAAIRWTGQTGGILDAFFIRGFSIGEGNLGEIAFDGQYGVAPNYRILTDYAERIEVVKGPAALLYGMSPNSGIGGVINIVPKRAGINDLTRASVDYSTSSQVGTALDLSRRFGDERQFGIRVNGSHHQGNTPVDKQSRKADVGAAALDFQGDKLRVSLDLIAQDERFDAPSRPFLMAAGLQVPTAPNGRRNVTQSWEWAKVEDRSALLKAEYDVTDKLTLFANAGGAHTSVARLFGTPTITNAAGDTRVRPDYFKFEIDRSTYDAGFRGKFNGAGIRHTVTLQASAYRDRMDRGSTNGSTITSNIYSPADRAAQIVAAPATVPEIAETKLSGFALGDTMSMLGDRLNVVLGVRQQQIKSDNFSPTTGAVTSSYDKSAVTPLLGASFKPWQKVSIYSNYIEGLSKGDIAPTTASNAGEVFAPYRAKQVELGVKFDYGQLLTTVSLFQITKPSGQLTGTVYAVDAEQRNRGLEVSISGEAAAGVRILGGLSLMNGELTRTNSTATQGKRPVGVPSVQANLGAEWDLPCASGLTLTSGLSYTGQQYVNQANTQGLPAWTRLDIGARYTTKVGGKTTTFRANIVNALDRTYWAGVASYGAFTQGAPRTVLLSAMVDF